MASTHLQTGWREKTLGEVAEILSGGTPSTKELAYWDGNIPWITPKDLSGFQGVFIDRGERNITEDGYNNSSAKKLQKNTILFSSRAPIGYVAIANNEVTTNQGFKNVFCDEKNSHFRFIYYWLIDKTELIKQLSSGSTFSEASGGLMKSLPILIPSINEQRAIAAVLSSLDDKIQLLRNQNRTLEAIAQRLFNEWFVEFNFPNSEGKPYKKSGGKMVDGELGEMPEGWIIGEIGNVIELFDSQRIPIASDIRAKRQGVYPYYGATTIMDNIDDYLFDGIYLLLAEDGSVQDKNGFPILQYVWGQFWVNNHAHVLRGVNGFSTEMLYLLFKKTPVTSIITGAVQLKINQKNLNDLKIILPPETLLAKCDVFVKEIFAKIRMNKDQIRSLSSIRNSLLPQMMSGTVKVLTT